MHSIYTSRSNLSDYRKYYTIVNVYVLATAVVQKSQKNGASCEDPNQ